MMRSCRERGCEQMAVLDSDLCYHHRKVHAGLCDPAPRSVTRGDYSEKMPVSPEELRRRDAAYLRARRARKRDRPRATPVMRESS